ncbi:MAG TPA: cupin domain-containing protein [Stellaceae bacterium]|nr:cupin domain-containing protein [Stellaceae bacterium]
MGDFRADMAAASVYPLWEREARDNQPPEPAHVWRWSALDPLLDEAVRATDMTNAERRVLCMRNPHLPEDRDGAAINLSVNLQVLMPGERARPHRHSMNALRFALEGDRATTIVEGKDCLMLPGDMILTPAWTWHEHKHEGKTRAVWVDVLDVPIHSYLGTRVFEPGPAHDLEPPPPDAAFVAAGLTPDTPTAAKPYSPLFRYPWDLASQALAALPAEKDGSRRLRYTNPATGGPIMATIDCFLLGLAKGRETAARKTNSNCVCVVMDGEGQSRIGEETVSWGPKDIFTVPHNEWATHKASRDARIFQITDRELLRRLDILRDEQRA